MVSVIKSRMPIVDEKAPSEVSFDSMVNELKDITPDTACVFNCQVDENRNDRRRMSCVQVCFATLFFLAQGHFDRETLSLDFVLKTTQ